MLKFIPWITIAFFIFSCHKKSKKEHPVPTFDLEYRFIIKGDTAIDLLNGFTSTVFTNEKIEDVISRDLRYPKAPDTLIIVPDLKGYPGVTMFFSIGIRKDWEPGVQSFRRWNIKRTVGGEADRVLTFVYPDDTLTAERFK